ncbi:hypothetical protein EAD96_18885 [Micromonospora sp. BL1]|uniref:Cytochrome c biogenesis protein CcdA n=2 Tax=Micromonospora TaxID=1873 RepID=A0ABR6MFV3_MICEC|nr:MULTISPECIES: GAP family protein [Micromonospora]MBB5114269.1 cytochrome c biogenesis protein CcdA [Micromonospora echinospora]NED50678.1 hypothetical protein [Micromonospora aurantiaca]RLQ03541.1 hypothetical protein EAD96_18885 [Micromonospora sp. BL1]
MIAGLFGLALLDSLNPSALAVTVYLLLSTRPPGARVLVYVGAIYASYLALGVLLFLGADSFLDRAGGYLASDAGYVLQGVVGVALLLYSWLAGRRRGGERLTPRRPRSHSYAAIALLGVIVTVAEFGTALPYLGAIGILVGADTSIPQAIVLLAAYNAVMVLPPLLVLAAYQALGNRIRQRLESAGTWLMRQAAELWLSVLSAAGALLVLSCVHHFELWKKIG